MGDRDRARREFPLRSCAFQSLHSCFGGVEDVLRQRDLLLVVLPSY